ncbi:hypothetical protein FH972_009317 [Carpinus fangiana]|uniref:Remorin C-terminal domain-containing protein n=1 Tax=Carpinus fangiana TaxID=176857 RepID=A0A5N6R3R4_9ROSI|nr:hypothetical protein FH972_009317 [Carpinus fangiana]KAE8023643.1 hypothetical protein FH972_009317 [Carpinus fangiana]
MRSIEDKGCYNHGSTQEISTSNTAISFEFHKGNGVTRTSHHHRTALGKPTPSKWDDAQKWLVGLSRVGEKKQSKTKPRNSNADDLRLIAPVPQKEQDYSSGEGEGEGEEEEEQQNGCAGSAITNQYEIETKKVDCDESVWRINKPPENLTPVVRSVCVRDMGTEMTPAASLEPSRTATPIRATTPAARSPIASGSSTPVRCQHGKQACEGYQTGLTSTDGRGDQANPTGRGSGAATRQCGGESNACKIPDTRNSDQAMSPLESRAVAWDEAERAKYMAR